MDALEFMVESNIKSETELFSIGYEEKKAGKKDLANFVLCRSTKALSDLLQNAWKMESASKKSFLLKANPHSHGRCADSCSLEWLNCALEVLQENSIYLSTIFQYCSPYS